MVEQVLAFVREHGGIEKLVEDHGAQSLIRVPYQPAEEGEDADKRHTYPLEALAESLDTAQAEGRTPLPDEVFPPAQLRGHGAGCGKDDKAATDMLRALGFDFFDFFDSLHDDESTASRKTASSDTKRVKGYAPWKPQKKTKVLLAQVQEILEEYRDYLPLTGRQIFYRLVGAYGYEKTEAAYDRLTDKLVRARRAGVIPFEKIRDDGAAVMQHNHYRDEDAFWGHIRKQGQAYRRDKLASQEVDIRVYCEAAGMMPQLHDICRPYSVPVFSCSGFDSLTAKWDLAQACQEAFWYQGRNTVILHLGDHDPSGDSIFNDGLVEDIHAFLATDVPHRRPSSVAPFERVALRREQVEEYNLDTSPPKESDGRTPNWSGTETAQLEALPPDVLAELLTDAIERHIDTDVYEKDVEKEKEEAQRIAKALPAPAKEGEE